MDLTIASELCPCSGVLSWSKYTRTPSINTFFLHAPSPPHGFGSKSTAAPARLLRAVLGKCHLISLDSE